ncbi:MAG TPA: SusC/RagA family TonB-linked outer membrane protein [Gemmatimonadaceae bacterium]|jgi:TonB-linked SusC/RagA family outer membrane protein
MKMLIGRAAAVAFGLALAWLPGTLRAQATGVIRGTVKSEGSNIPVGNAEITVVGTARGAHSDPAGAFRITGVATGAHQVRVTHIGEVAQTRSVTLAAGDSAVVDFVLKDAVLSLDAIVVTGTAAQSRQKEVGNAMATIDTKAFENAPVSNTQDILTASAPGVTVLQNSGQPGTGGTIRLRGVNSITQGNNPIIYVDGVRIYSDPGPITPGARQSTNAFNDIKPEDIDHIEIVKGAAATTLYGTQASGGVIQIFTKRGAATAPQWTVSVAEGLNSTGHVGPSSDPNGLYFNNCAGVKTAGDGTQFMDPTCPSNGTWLQDGPVQRYELNVHGGSDALNYYLSGNYNQESGVIRTGGDKNGGFRANFGFSPARNLLVTVNSAYDKKNISWLPDGNYTNGFTLNVFRGSSNNFKGGKGDDCSSVPTGVSCITNGYILDQQIANDADHFISGLTVNWAPVTGLTQRFNAGFDYNNSSNTLLEPFGFLSLPTGSLSDAEWNHTKLSLDYAGSYQNTIKTFASTFSWGGQLFDDRERYTTLTGTNLSGPGEPTLESFANRTLGVATAPRVVNGGFFVQEMVGWKDRLFLTGGLRVDGNSAFGSSFGLQKYPKISASYVLSDESWWPKRFVETMKLRGAIGESGKAPGAFDAVRTWDPSPGDNGKPGVSIAQRGNPDLGPEVTRESEVGFDIGALDNRLGLQVTGFRARTDRALIGVVYPASEGFSTSQLTNVGSLQNEGLEAQLNGTLIQSRDLEWQARVNLTSLGSKALDVGGVPIATGLGSYVREGYAVPSYFGTTILNPSAVGAPQYSTTSDQFIGAEYPNHILSYGSTFTFRGNLTLDALLEEQRGGVLDNYIGFQNAKRFVWQPCFATQAALRAALGPDGKSGTGDDNASALNGFTASQRARCSINTAEQNSDYWYSKTNFVKLRTVSLSYRLPQRFSVIKGSSTQLTIAGRNLFTWTDYDGVDPESSDQSDAGTGLGRREYYQLPPYRTFLATLRLTF